MTEMTKRVTDSSGVRIALAAAAAAALLFIGACKTTEGAGKDIENLGENIQDATND